MPTELSKNIDVTKEQEGERND
jgi:hypothetical protein